MVRTRIRRRSDARVGLCKLLVLGHRKRRHRRRPAPTNASPDLPAIRAIQLDPLWPSCSLSDRPKAVLRAALVERVERRADGGEGRILTAPVPRSQLDSSLALLALAIRRQHLVPPHEPSRRARSPALASLLRDEAARFFATEGQGVLRAWEDGGRGGGTAKAAGRGEEAVVAVDEHAVGVLCCTR